MNETYELFRHCPDSDCGGIAEPEEELAEGGLLLYWACAKCGTEFGHQIQRDEAQAGSCSMGIPEGVRRAVSAEPRQPVFLGTIGRRPQ